MVRGIRNHGTEQAVLSHFAFGFAPRQENGEDADPLHLLLGHDRELVAVFDGMGGSGSAKYELPNGENRSGAWIASRYIRDTTQAFFSDLFGAASQEEIRGTALSLVAEDPAAIVIALETHLKMAVSQRAASLGAAGSGRLKGTMGRVLPTTIAGGWIDATVGRVDAFWAGDSRVFLLTPTRGLQQLSVDDLVSGADAMANLSDDSPLSNHICADRDFILHHHSILGITAPAILIAATDGCFGYSRTPAHFERLLLRSLRQSETPAKWGEVCATEVESISGDDATLSAVILGAFDDVRCALLKRLVVVENLLDYDDAAQQALRNAEAALEGWRLETERTLAGVWNGYRADYEQNMWREGAS